MTSFAALDQILHAQTLTTVPGRELAPAADQGAFLPFVASALAAAKPQGTHGHGEPQIELIQENGRIQQIVVTCRCGERTVLDCAY